MNMQEGSNTQDFEINLAPILDCFTVLVTFLLASASFISLSSLDAGIGAPAAGGDTAENSVIVPVRLLPEGKIRVEWPKQAARVLADVNELKSVFSGHLTARPIAVLSTDAGVPVQAVVQVLDVLRRSEPATRALLGGLGEK